MNRAQVVKGALCPICRAPQVKPVNNGFKQWRCGREFDELGMMMACPKSEREVRRLRRALERRSS